MATITIPSPSAFLRSPITKPSPSPRPKVSVKASTKKKSTSAKHNRKSALQANGQSKPKQTKSRDGTCLNRVSTLSQACQMLTSTIGCRTCKEKRLKCDETKPVCQQCDKKGVQCEGYEKVLKWRPQEDTFKTKPASPRPRKSRFEKSLPILVMADNISICQLHYNPSSSTSCLLCTARTLWVTHGQ